MRDRILEIPSHDYGSNNTFIHINMRYWIQLKIHTCLYERNNIKEGTCMSASRGKVNTFTLKKNGSEAAFLKRDHREKKTRLQPHLAYSRVFLGHVL